MLFWIVLFQIKQSPQTRREYKDDWSKRKTLKLLLNKSMSILSPSYPVKHNGRFWTIQWEIHKIFRMRIMKMDSDIRQF